MWEIGSLGLITSSLLLQEGPNENESLQTKLSSQKVSKLLKSGSLLKGNPASFHPDAAEKHSACWFLHRRGDRLPGYDFGILVYKKAPLWCRLFFFSHNAKSQCPHAVKKPHDIMFNRDFQS